LKREFQHRTVPVSVGSELRVVNGIDNSHDFFELLRKTQGNTIQKMRVATRTESSDSQNLWSGHGQTRKNIGLPSVLPYGI
jgi:hypothetical protein